MRNVREDLATVMTFAKLRCIIMKYFLVVLKPVNDLKPFPHISHCLANSPCASDICLWQFSFLENLTAQKLHSYSFNLWSDCIWLLRFLVLLNDLKQYSHCNLLLLASSVVAPFFSSFWPMKVEIIENFWDKVFPKDSLQSIDSTDHLY